MVEFSYSLHEDQAAKDSRIDPFYYGSHKAMIRPPEIPHHRIKRTVDGKFIHVSKAEIAPEDMADFLESDPAAYQWETKTPLLWTAPQGSLPPEMFPTYWGDLEPLDPQWPRESSVLDEADEIDKLLARHDAGLELRKTSGDHIGTTVDAQVGAEADDGTRYTGTIEFTAGASPNGYGFFDSSTSGEQDSYHRFTGISISDTIDVSFLSVSSVFAVATPELQIFVVAQDNPAAPTTRAEFDADPLTTGLAWDDVWTDDEFNDSPSLNADFQELVDAFTISSDAVMVYVLNDHGTPVGNDRQFSTSYDQDTSLAAKLHIEFSVAADDFISAITQTPTHLGRFGPATMVPY